MDALNRNLLSGKRLKVYFDNLKNEDFKKSLARMLRTIVNMDFEYTGDKVPPLETVYAMLGKATIRLNKIAAFQKRINEWESRFLATRIIEVEDLKENCTKQVNLLTEMAYSLMAEKEKKAYEVQSLPAQLSSS